MDSQKILNADYLDIVFDNRNKAYGGYLLRKEYEHRTRKALTFAVLSATLLMGYFSWLTHKSPAAIFDVTGKPAVFTDVTLPDIPKPIAPIKPPSQTPATATNPVSANSHFVITHNQDVSNIDHPTLPTTIAVTPGLSTIGSTIPGKTPGTDDIDHAGAISTNVIKDWVEIMPWFKGDMYKYLGEHLRFPEEAKRAGANGKVYVRFIINEDGSVTDAKMLRGDGSYGFEDEAIRVISSMPKWNPGRQNNIPVKVYYTIPIVFVLQ